MGQYSMLILKKCGSNFEADLHSDSKFTSFSLKVAYLACKRAISLYVHI